MNTEKKTTVLEGIAMYVDERGWIGYISDDRVIDAIIVSAETFEELRAKVREETDKWATERLHSGLPVEADIVSGNYIIDFRKND